MSVVTGATELDPFDVRRVRGAAGLLGEFNAAGVLTAADVHVASRLAAIAGEYDESVMLALALAVRAPRLGARPGRPGDDPRDRGGRCRRAGGRVIAALARSGGLDASGCDAAVSSLSGSAHRTLVR